MVKVIGQEEQRKTFRRCILPPSNHGNTRNRHQGRRREKVAQSDCDTLPASGACAACRPCFHGRQAHGRGQPQHAGKFPVIHTPDPYRCRDDGSPSDASAELGRYDNHNGNMLRHAHRAEGLEVSCVGRDIGICGGCCPDYDCALQDETLQCLLGPMV